MGAWGRRQTAVVGVLSDRLVATVVVVGVVRVVGLVGVAVVVVGVVMVAVVMRVVLASAAGTFLEEDGVKLIFGPRRCCVTSATRGQGAG